MQEITEQTKRPLTDYPYQNPELPLETRVVDLISRFTREEKVQLMCQFQPAVPRLGIKAHKQGTEAAHGVAWLGKATVFPQPAGLACTWDPDLLKEVGDAISTEARAFHKKDPEKNGLTLWAPTVDMERDPRWGRTEEAYGEDPYLTGTLAAHLIKGIQGDHPFYFKAVATLKHFLANNNEINRGTCSASIDPRNMHEYYLKPFEQCFKEGGAYSMMTSYNSINGTPAILHPYVKEVVKEEWGMNGFVVSDAGDLLGVKNEHGYYSSHAEAAAHAVKNGIDSMTEETEPVAEALHEALQKGLLFESDLDQALRNTFRVRFRLGEFDPPEKNPYASIQETVICDEAHSRLSLQAARKSVVLLKNDHQMLPLHKGLERVAVIGTLGNQVYRDWYSGSLPYEVTPLDGIRRKIPDAAVSYHSGNDTVVLRTGSTPIGINKDGALSLTDTGSGEEFERADWGWNQFTLKSTSTQKYVTVADDEQIIANAEEVYGWFTKEVFESIQEQDGRTVTGSWDHKYVIRQKNGGFKAQTESGEGLEIERITDGIREAAEIARQAETAIVFVGNHPLINGKETADREDISLADSQQQLIREVFKANPNTVVVVTGSYPFALNWEDEHIPAIVYSAHLGQEAGTAISDVLFGDYNPAGRLNMTWYTSADLLPDIEDYDVIKGRRTYMYTEDVPLYPFGHGLSYAQFEYEEMKIKQNKIDETEQAEIQLTVHNNSSLAGEEVIQLYVSAKDSRYKRPVKQLIRFARISLESGERKDISFTVPAEELALWDVSQSRKLVESGAYEFLAGASSTDIRQSVSFEVIGETIPARNLYTLTQAENYDDYELLYLDECKEGGTCICPKLDGAWASYRVADFLKGAVSLELRTANPSLEAGTVSIYLGNLDESPIGTAVIPPSGSSQQWQTITCSAEIPAQTEAADLYLKLSANVRIRYFRFIS